MYNSAHFREERLPVLHELIRREPFATLVTLGPDGLVADHLPMLLDPDAVSKALAHLDDAEAKRASNATGDEAPIAIATVERELARQRREYEGESGVDLIVAGINAIHRLLAR